MLGRHNTPVFAVWEGDTHCIFLLLISVDERTVYVCVCGLPAYLNHSKQRCFQFTQRAHTAGGGITTTSWHLEMDQLVQLSSTDGYYHWHIQYSITSLQQCSQITSVYMN